MNRILSRINLRFVWPIALLIVAVIAAADYYSGVLITVSAFYLLPLFLVAWTRTRPETHLLVVVIIIAWTSANYLSDGAHLSRGVIAWNFLIRWLHLTLTAELIRYVSLLLKINSELANTDSLTGIPNRRSINSKMENLLAFPALCKITTFTLIDVDFFKTINDNHGHQHGDALLKRVSQVLSKECLKNEFCGRLGGDEFAILLCCEDFPDVKNRMKRLAARLSDEAASCSLGTSFVNKGELITDIFEQADKALYQTKSGGRGFATIFDGTSYHKAI